MQTWTEALRVGVPEIDGEHQEIFEVCARLNSAVEGSEFLAASDLVFLGRYVDQHFAHEEQLMKDTAYPRAAEHAQEHVRYRGALSALLARPMTESGLIQEVALSVTTWLLFHIQHEDRALASHIASRDASAR